MPGHKTPDQFDRDELARIAVADQMRRVHHALVGLSHPTGELEALADRLSVEADRLSAGGPRVRDEVRWKRPDLMAAPIDGEEFPNAVDRPVSGRGNPWSVPLRVMRNGDRAEATVHLGKGYEGAPDRAHGGVVAAIYDDLFGFLLMFEHLVAFTAFIKVDYRAATPLGADITFSTWISSRDGRKLHMHGECVADGVVITTAEALFIEMDLSNM